MLSTDEYIALLKDDNVDELYREYSIVGWSNHIDFKRVYDETKNIENNSSIYHCLGLWIYMYSYHNAGGESECAKGFYYLRKSEKMGNQSAKRDIADLLTIKPSYFQDNSIYVELATDVVNMMDKYLELEEENKMLKLKLEFVPNGTGYHAAKADFEKHRNT